MNNSFIQPDNVDNKPYVFLSYSRRDMNDVQNILKILRNNHFRFWYDMGLKSGTEWAEELGEKIDQCDQFIVLISENSIKSKYVRKEVGMATDKDKHILVIYLSETTLTSGLHFLLGDIQAIHKDAFKSVADFERAVCDAISKNTLYRTEEELVQNSYMLGEAKSELQKNYNLLRQIAQGAVGAVYLAENIRTNALVVVKYGITDDSLIGKETKERFRNEKRILSNILHNMCPFIPNLLDCFQDDDQIFLVETLVSGKTLQNDVFYSEKETVEIAKKILNILQHLHQNGVIHRDIKPDNLIQDKFGNIFLVDFDIARHIEDAEDTTMGTVGFASPEQYITHINTNFSSDIFALGRTLKCLLCSTHFDKNMNPPIRYNRKDISVEFEDILEKMTANNQNNRYQSAEELLKILERYNQLNICNVLKKAYLLMKSRMRIHRYSKYIQEKRLKQDISFVGRRFSVSQDNTTILHN